MHGDEEVVCRLCGKTYTREDNMLRHMASEHNGGSGEDVVGTFRDNKQRPPQTGDEDLDRTLRRNCVYVRTKVRRCHVVDVLNVRLWDGRTATEGFDNGVWFLLQRCGTL